MDDVNFFYAVQQTANHERCALLQNSGLMCLREHAGAALPKGMLQAGTPTPVRTRIYNDWVKSQQEMLPAQKVTMVNGVLCIETNADAMANYLEKHLHDGEVYTFISSKQEQLVTPEKDGRPVTVPKMNWKTAMVLRAHGVHLPSGGGK